MGDWIYWNVGLVCSSSQNHRSGGTLNWFEQVWGWAGQYLCLVRRPHVQSFDGVTDGHVTVHAHDSQREGAGEHVVVVNGYHRLAQDVPERPEPQEHVGALKTSRENRCVETWLILEQ